MTPSNNPRLINWPSEDEIAQAVEGHSFQVPYNGTNDFYNEDVARGFDRAIAWLSTRLEPEASQPVFKETPESLNKVGLNSRVHPVEQHRIDLINELAALRKETLNLKMTIVGLEDAAIASRQELHKVMYSPETVYGKALNDLQQQNTARREALIDLIEWCQSLNYTPDAYYTARKVLSSGEKKPETPTT